MQVDPLNLLLYVLAALVLLGSPGPGIAALVAIGRERGFRGGQPFLWGLQAGLALAAAACATGLFSLIRGLPFALPALAALSIGYLLWLAAHIALAPVGVAASEGRAVQASPAAGFLLGISNPKAYLVFLSLMGSYLLVRAAPASDAGLKWLLIVAVIVSVDLAWLWIGAAIGRLSLAPGRARALNIAMGAAVALAALLSLHDLVTAFR